MSGIPCNSIFQHFSLFFYCLFLVAQEMVFLLKRVPLAISTNSWTPSLPPSCCRRLSSSAIMGIKERPFSESPAYYGKDRAFDKTDFSIPLYIPSYYDSQRFKRIKKASWLGSILVLFIYFGVFREPKDWDEMFNMDSRLIGVMQTKQMLKLRKEKLLLQGKSTHEVDAEMLDLIGQEAVIKAKLREEGKRKNLGKRRIPKQTKIEEKNQNSEGRRARERRD